MGRRRWPEVNFSRASLVRMGRPPFVEGEIQGGLPVSLKLKYKIVLYACKSSFLLLKFGKKKKYFLCIREN